MTEIRSLQEAAQERQRAADEVEAATAAVDALRPEFNAAGERLRQAKMRLKELDAGMAAVTQTYATTQALADAGIEYPEPPLVVTTAYGTHHDIYHLVAVGSKGTGLYLHKPERSHRHQGREHAILIKHAERHDAARPQYVYESQQKAGIWPWEERGHGPFGAGSGSMKPKPPPEGGRWKWLKVREQEALEA